MKIEESPFQFSNVQGGQRPPRMNPSLDGTLDNSDLKFLSLLNSLTGSVEVSAIQQLDTDSPAAPEKELASKTEKTTKNTAKLPDVKPVSDPTAPDREFSSHDLKKELDMLNTDLTSEDTDFLKTIVPPGMPVMPSVPIQNLMPVDEDGNLRTEQMPVSTGLAALLEKAYKTGHPIRVELDGGSSVILKIQQGKVSAEFLTADQATALYLKQHLADLKNKLEARNLPVGNLDSRRDSPSRRQKNEDSAFETEESATSIEN